MFLGIEINSFIIFLILRKHIKLAAKGIKTDKIAPPDLDCRIFFFLYSGVVFKAMDLISFFEGFTCLIILGQVVKFYLESFYKFLKWCLVGFYLELVLGGFCSFVVVWKNILEIYYF